MQDNKTNSFPEDHQEEGMPEAQERGEEIFSSYETHAEEPGTELHPEELAPVLADATPVAETEATEDAAAAEAGKAVLREILADEANFETALGNASASELVLLAEAMARETEVRPLLPKVPLLRKAFDKHTSNPDNPEPPSAALISRLNTAIARFNKKRTEFFAQQEKEKEENTKLKQELLDRLKKIVEAEKVTAITEVREIQARWKEIGWVSQDQKQNINETYKYLLDLFYTQRGKLLELRDYDRKLNLEEKLKIIGEIESLIPAESDLSRETWNNYTQKLKNLQEFWRTIGPVPRENAEEINEKLKNALDSFFSLRQEYYQAQDSIKEENATLKREVLEKLKTYTGFKSDKAKDWNLATDEVVKLQEEWKKIGPAPFEINRQLWKEYRAICDGFFEGKGEFFKKFDAERNENLRRKTAICEQAEAVMNNENLKETAEILRKLQEEWKQIGPVHDRFSNKIWKRFRTACDNFFKRREEIFNQGSDEQKQNLARKEEMIARLKAILESDDDHANVEEVKEMQANWRNIGHVPFAEKEKVNKEFRELADKFFKRLHSNRGSYSTHRPRAEKKMEKIDEIKDTDTRIRKIKFEISKLKEKLSIIRDKVSSYETNIQMVSKGKSGDGLRKMIQGQIDDEKVNVKKIEDEIKSLNEKLKAPPAAETETPPAAEQTVTAETPVAEQMPAEHTAAEPPADGN